MLNLAKPTPQSCRAGYRRHAHPAEVDYLIRAEWARGADDVVWRRTKLGLRLDGTQVERLDRFMVRAVAALASGLDQPRTHQIG